MKIRLLSVLVAVITTVTLLSITGITASAADNSVAKVGATEYPTIDEAIANWTDGSTLTLLADVALSDVITLKSTEHHYLDLSTFTMTAAQNKNAIQITSNGFANRNERPALTIYADALNPGGINANNKACIYYKYDKVLANNKVDRPLVTIHNGVFTSTSAGLSSSTPSSSQSSSWQDQCATFDILGGRFDCTIGLYGAKLLIKGGTFNKAVNCTGGSTNHRWISGGRFKTLGSFTTGATKFGISSES